MRCSIYDQSKYGYKPQAKQCKGVAMKKMCIPTHGKDILTDITYARVCPGHYAALMMAKRQATIQLNQAEATNSLKNLTA